MLLGTRQVWQSMLRPFKAVIDLGGAKGVMMAYSELDDIPSHVHPMLYKALDDWEFDGFVTADDNGVVMLQARHKVAASPASAIMQWFNAGISPIQLLYFELIYFRWHDTVLRLSTRCIPERNS